MLPQKNGAYKLFATLSGIPQIDELLLIKAWNRGVWKGKL